MKLLIIVDLIICPILLYNFFLLDNKIFAAHEAARLPTRLL